MSTNSPTEPVKVVFWDLDGTIWQGTLEEDTADALIPLAHMVHAINAIDDRGILNSIVTQASEEAASTKLRELDLFQYFVAPKYEVANKAAAISSSLHELNLLPANAAFIDDLSFYRAEVAFLLPQVLVCQPDDIVHLLESPRFAPTNMGSERRKQYQVEEYRRRQESTFAGDRVSFLQHCNMELMCTELTTSDHRLLRAQELLERAHRLSASGPGGISGDDSSPPIIFSGSLSDRFGDYGLIAVATGSVTSSMLTLSGLAISCRVQGRGVIEAFLSWLTQWTESRGLTLQVKVATSSKVNMPLRTVLRFSGFSPVDRGEGWELLSCKKPEMLSVPEWIRLTC